MFISVDKSQHNLWAAKTPHPDSGDCTLAELAALQGERNRLYQCLGKGPKSESDCKILSHICIFLSSALYVSTGDMRSWINDALNAGLTPNPTNTPWTPLQICVWASNDVLVAWLLQAGADPKAVTDLGGEKQTLFTGCWHDLAASGAYTSGNRLYPALAFGECVISKSPWMFVGAYNGRDRSVLKNLRTGGGARRNVSQPRCGLEILTKSRAVVEIWCNNHGSFSEPDHCHRCLGLGGGVDVPS